MITLIRNVRVFAPEELGVQDVLIIGEKIIRIAPDLEEWTALPGVNIFDGRGRYLVPGFIDQHVHILGGGGAAGFGSRGPELTFSEAILTGTTTVIGCVGVDQTGRDLCSLVAKARSLDFRGMTSFVYTGGFDMRSTVTGSVKSDIFLIDKFIGAKVAVSDRRSAHPSLGELKRLMSEAMLGGLLSGKAGVVHIHMGDTPAGLTPIIEAQKETEIPIKFIVPTHINRNELLIEQAAQWLRMGGVVDLTSSIGPTHFKRAASVKETVKNLVEGGAAIEQITISTDANGVSTIFGFDKVERFPLKLLYQDFKQLVLDGVLSLEDALKCVSTNVARILRLEGKGRVVEDADADLLLLDPESFAIEMVMTRGKVVAERGNIVTTQKLDV